MNEISYLDGIISENKTPISNALENYLEECDRNPNLLKTQTIRGFIPEIKELERDRFLLDAGIKSMPPLERAIKQSLTQLRGHEPISIYTTGPRVCTITTEDIENK